MKARTPVDHERIARFCRKWKLEEFSLFGSVLREDFGPDSDVDILVSFAEDAHCGLFELTAMEDELKQIFGREVDLVTRRAVEDSQNYIRRKHILQNREMIHAR